MDSSSAFKMNVERHGTTVRLTLAGDFDQPERDLVVDALDNGDTPTAIIIEMSGVGFVGSAGLAALLHASRQLEPVGRQVILENPSPAIVQLLDMTRLTSSFTIRLT